MNEDSFNVSVSRIIKHVNQISGIMKNSGIQPVPSLCYEESMLRVRIRLMSLMYPCRYCEAPS